MSGTYIPISQFATQLAAGGAGADLSYWTATTGTGGTPRSLAAAFSDAPFIEWFGVCGLGGDDTGVFTKAVQSGIPFCLGPKTYIINGSWSSGGLPRVLIGGYAGVSRLLRMEAGTTGAWVGFESNIVVVYGVIFDANGSQVQANTWNVLVDAGVSLAEFRDCAFRNNSGALGRGVAIQGPGSDDGTASYCFAGCEFSGNSSDGCGVFRASNVTISDSRIFGNGGSGIGVGVNGTPTAINMCRSLLIKGNRIFNNAVDGINIGTINPSNATPPVYTLGSPSLSQGNVIENYIWNNASYGIQVYGDYINVHSNQIVQQNPAAGGIVMTARYSRISHNMLDVAGAYIGIDSGGCIDCEVCHNIVVGPNVGINPGGSQYVSVTDNKVIGCTTALTVYDVETDGSGYSFPAALSGLTVERNTIIISDSGTGVSVFDGGTGVAVLENRVFGSDISVNPDQAIVLRSGDTLLRGNTWNGLDRIDLSTTDANILVVPDIFDNVRVTTDGATLDSVVPSSLIRFAGEISFVVVTAPGSGYTHASAFISGVGSGAAVTVILYAGEVIGFRVTENGSGYTQASTSCVVMGDGVGAQASVVVGTPVQSGRKLRLLAPGGATMKQSGAFTSQLNTTANDLILVANSVVDLVETGGAWLVTGFYPAAILQLSANGNVTIAAQIGASLTLSPGAGGSLTIADLPTSATGLPGGAIWRSGNIINVV
jgi:hypothetical protein